MQQEKAVPVGEGTPILQAKAGSRGTIVRISADKETRKFLNDLGFTIGARIFAVSDTRGNKILSVRGSKIAVDRRLAANILYCPE